MLANEQNNKTISSTKPRPVELFWTSYKYVFVCVILLIDGKIKCGFNVSVWLIGEIKEEDEGVCAYLTLFVFLMSFEERKFIHDTRTNVIINKSKCTAAFDIRPLMLFSSKTIFVRFFVHFLPKNFSVSRVQLSPDKTSLRPKSDCVPSVLPH